MATLPDSLPDDARALKELLLAERAENDRLIAIIKELQRHRFGPRSEKLDPDQLALMLEDVEQSVAAGEAETEAKRENEPARAPAPRKRQINRGALPRHLPREEVVVDVADKSCPCCNRIRVKIGEDVSERLDMIPARFKVIVTRRPKYACRDCEGEVAQAPAPEHLIEGGIPTEALIAAVVISKYADHLPLYRQAQIYGRQGVDLDRSTLSDWSGRAAFALRPVYERLFDVLKKSDKLFADETRAHSPSLDGRLSTPFRSIRAGARPRPASSGLTRATTGPGAARSRRASPMSTSPTANTSARPRIWLASPEAFRSTAMARTRRWPTATWSRWRSAGRTRGATSSTFRPRTRPRSPSRRWRGSAASTPSNAKSGGWGRRRDRPPVMRAPGRSSRR
jgi:transposase